MLPFSSYSIFTLNVPLPSYSSGIDVSLNVYSIVLFSTFCLRDTYIFLLDESASFSSNIVFSLAVVPSEFSSFDVIVSNPPYIREDEEVEKIVLDNEPHMALYAKEKGLYFYHEILKNASKYLNSKFLIAFEIGVGQGDEIKEFAKKYLGDVNVLIENDYSDRERFVFIYRD